MTGGRAADEPAPRRRPPGAGPAPRSPRERELVSRFVDAFEAADVGKLVDLLTDDAWLTMPPEPLEYQGHAAIAQFYVSRTWWGAQPVRLVPTRANNQPAFGYYLRDPQASVARAHGLIVLTLAGDKICAITRFGDNSLFPHFGLRPAASPVSMTSSLPARSHSGCGSPVPRRSTPSSAPNSTRCREKLAARWTSFSGTEATALEGTIRFARPAT